MHGPTRGLARCARHDGALKVVAERKRVIAPALPAPLLRGPLRLVEAFAFLPRVQARACPRPVPVRAARGPRCGRRRAPSAVQAVRRAPTQRGGEEVLAGRALARAGGALAARGRARRVPRRRAHRDRELRARRAARARARALRHAPRRPAARRRRRRRTSLASRARALPRRRARRRHGRRRRRVDRDLRLDAAQPAAPARAGAREAGPRVPAPGRDGRADARAARGRRGRARRLPGAREALEHGD